MTIEKIRRRAENLIPPSVREFFGRLSTHQGLAILLAWGMAMFSMLQIHPVWVPTLGTIHAWLPFFGLAGMLILVLFLVATYLRLFEQELLSSVPQFYLLSLVSGGTLLAFCVLHSLQASPFLTPLAMEAMLLTIFLGTRLAFFITLVTGLVGGFAYGLDPGVLTVAMVGSFSATFSVTRMRQRFDLGRAGLVVSLVQVIMVAALAAILDGPWQIWLLNGMWAAVSGVASAIIAIGVLPYIEGIFGITTVFKLMELANPSHPLLRQLLLKAPGTYHHCILVGNLGEAAAEALGADPLLVRVGAYYHDIGKIKRPYFFIENQLGMDNQHERINPRLSTLVITSHVREGLELAREHRIPKAVQDFISQHHGKSLVSYFYHQAIQSENPKQVQEEHFRYPGPRPQTKETAIVMLADAVEASVRSLNRPTPEQIEAMVRKIVHSRLSDGELSESPLTLKEIETIIGTFNRILQGLYHTRIEYPDQLIGELKQQEKKKLGHLSRESAR
ncbi:MAG: HD family phosphohydrolase [Bacteroidota bacterium]